MVNVLARDSNPLSVWAQSYIPYRQSGSVQYFLELVAVECVLAHCAILGSSDEEAVLRSPLAGFCIRCWHTYTSYYGCIVFLAIVYCHRLVVGSGTEHAAVVVNSGRNELLSVRCVCEVSCAGGVCVFSQR